MDGGETVIRETSGVLPRGEVLPVRNLEASVQQHRSELTFSAVFWILRGAAGVFIPLETGLQPELGVRPSIGRIGATRPWASS